jgi:cysteinyl-tRNA synthetase
MSEVFLFNTLTRKKENFEPLEPPNVGIYTCGPTVYYFPHIGNWRTFVFEDVLRRVLEYNGFKVKHVMNVTDVGHLTGDNVGDADIGEDRMEKAAAKEGKTAWEIAEHYTKDFVESRQELNILAPHHFVKATDHVQEQIVLIQRLEEKGLTYKTGMGVYFDVSKYPEYGKLSGQKLKDKRSATREELIEDKEKRQPQDFALWKFSQPNEKRHMEWDSPWGKGYPGWHIECSAMSLKYLGETFDIHTGGVDHIAIHHTNEIAQSEGATGKTFAKVWLHGEFLKVDGGRMGKSLGNAYTLHDIKKKGYDPLSLRYLFLTAYYRDTLNFTWESLQSAANALAKIRENIIFLRSSKDRTILSPEKKIKVDSYIKRFKEAVNDDLNTPVALAVVWEVLKSNIPSEDKYDLLISFDEILGLDLRNTQEFEAPPEIVEMLGKREALRNQGKYDEADKLREEIEKAGYRIFDTQQGAVLRPKP